MEAGCTEARLQGVTTGIPIGVALGALGLRHLRRCLGAGPDLRTYFGYTPLTLTLFVY